MTTQRAPDRTELPDARQPAQVWGGRRWTLIAAVGVLALIAMAAVFSWQGRSSSQPPNSVPGKAATPDQPGGNLGRGDPQVPTTAPQDITWQVWHAVALPSSPTAGPARVNGQVATGFAHTPVGALVAGVQAMSRKTAATDPGWRDVVDAMIAPGPGRDAWIKQRSQMTLTDEPVAGTFAQVAGFQIVSYTPSDAVIQIVTNSDGILSVLNTHEVWVTGDWKLVLAPDGGDATSRQTVSGLAGFIAWGGI